MPGSAGKNDGGSRFAYRRFSSSVPGINDNDTWPEIGSGALYQRQDFCNMA
jgi:hypothetical protein